MESIKKKNIIEFIRVAILRPEQINAILPHMVRNAASLKSEEEIGLLLKNVEKKILSTEHLERFVSHVEAIFSEEEIKRLLEFYRDPVIGKYFKEGVSIGPMIYPTFMQVIQEFL